MIAELGRGGFSPPQERLRHDPFEGFPFFTPFLAPPPPAEEGLLSSGLPLRSSGGLIEFLRHFQGLRNSFRGGGGCGMDRAGVSSVGFNRVERKIRRD